MYILGIHVRHNATVALLKDGQILGCVSEERFVGQKNFSGYPEQGIAYLLDLAGITPEQLDYVALAGTFNAPVQSTEDTQRHPLMRVLIWLWRPADLFRQWYGLLAYYVPLFRTVGYWCYCWMAHIIGPLTTARERRSIARRLGIPLKRVIAFEHHYCHAYTAAFASPYANEDQLVLTLDGEGDMLCATVNIARQGTLTRIASTPLGNSIGWVYMELTQFLGMRPGEDEYKIMGLAPYAKPSNVERCYPKIAKLVWLDRRNPLCHRGRFDTHQIHHFLKTRMGATQFDTLAGGFQRLLEDLVTAWAKEAMAHTGIHTLALGGGVFMNVKADQRIAELPEIERLFVLPTAGDESNAVGAAYQAYLQHGPAREVRPPIQPFDTIYWGPTIHDEEVAVYIAQQGLRDRYLIRYVEDIEDEVAELLSRQEIVARVAGRMEWGARALGNRSILAHPGNPDMLRVINETIKYRDFWMPLAPSILQEREQDYVVNPKRIPARFMAITFDSTPLARSELRAALHPYDWTIRPQIVHQDTNPSYYRVLKAFERRTKIGGILNTSYNMHRKPIVLGPREAFEALECSGLKHLALGHYLIQKRTYVESAHASRPAYGMSRPSLANQPG